MIPQEKPPRPQATQDVIVIGGGVSGLAAGCYLQMNGYRTRILEKNAACGGVSVAWRRGDYLFDGATNWLAGSGPGVPEIYQVVRELIDFSRTPLLHFDEFIRVEQDGSAFNVYSDVDRLEQEMRRLGPSDHWEIARFTGAVRELSKVEIPFADAPDILSLGQLLRFPFTYRKAIRLYRKWRGLSLDAYARRFQSPHLRAMFPLIFPHHGEFSVFAVISMLSWMHRRSAGYPVGGTQVLIDRLMERYRSLGGEILTRRPVSEILVERGVATGVLGEDGTRHAARVVVSAADMHHTLNGLLGGRHTSPKLGRHFDMWPVFPAVIQVSVGVARRFDGVPNKMSIPLARPLQVGDETVTQALVRICNFDTVFAPAGKTPLIAHLRTRDPGYWVSLRRDDRAAYQREKERALHATIDTLEHRFGNIRDRVEETDVATPATYIRYTNVWKGSYQAFAPVPGAIGRRLPRTLPGLENFYFACQWLSPAGGLPVSMVLGRQAAQLICRRDKRRFVTSLAHAAPETRR